MTQAEYTGRLLTADELARRLYVGSAMVRDLERTGRIPSIRLSPRTVRFDFTEVVEALRSDKGEGGSDREEGSV